ncbi:MAG: hypothetical protein HGA36_03390 [Candidatus Moranbacteria bacterium]|nr:hypothetical protein [Candidatus Moranbacteria bacterium]
MKINLRGLIMNLTKNNAEIAKSSFIPGRLSKIEKEMKAGTITVSEVMVKLRDEEKFRKAISDNDWKMIEREVEKTLK